MPHLEHILEGVLLAAGEPLSIERLEAVFDDHNRPGRRAIREALKTLEARLDESALTLEETASGFRLRVRDSLTPWVSKLFSERPQRYSRALLETLALIAYRQPVTRADIEEVRGVSVSASIMRTLVERGWVRVIGHRDVPGRPAVYATTRSFLDDFGLRTLEALPPMSAVGEGQTVDWLEQLVPGAGEALGAPAGDSAVPGAQTEHQHSEGVASERFQSEDASSKLVKDKDVPAGHARDEVPIEKAQAEVPDPSKSAERARAEAPGEDDESGFKRLGERLSRRLQQQDDDRQGDERSTKPSDKRD